MFTLQRVWIAGREVGRYSQSCGGRVEYEMKNGVLQLYIGEEQRTQAAEVLICYAWWLCYLCFLRQELLLQACSVTGAASVLAISDKDTPVRVR